MSDDTKPNNGEQATCRRLHTAIEAEASEIGPHELDDDEEPLMDKPLPEASLQEWVIVMSWVDPATGRSFLTRATSSNLPRHHENGLLYEALFGFD